MYHRCPSFRSNLPAEEPPEQEEPQEPQQPEQQPQEPHPGQPEQPPEEPEERDPEEREPEEPEERDPEEPVEAVKGAEEHSQMPKDPWQPGGHPEVVAVAVEDAVGAFEQMELQVMRRWDHQVCVIWDLVYG